MSGKRPVGSAQENNDVFEGNQFRAGLQMKFCVTEKDMLVQRLLGRVCCLRNGTQFWYSWGLNIVSCDYLEPRCCLRAGSSGGTEAAFALHSYHTCGALAIDLMRFVNVEVEFDDTWYCQSKGYIRNCHGLSKTRGLGSGSCVHSALLMEIST